MSQYGFHALRFLPLAKHIQADPTSKESFMDQIKMPMLLCKVPRNVEQLVSANYQIITLFGSRLRTSVGLLLASRQLVVQSLRSAKEMCM